MDGWVGSFTEVLAGYWAQIAGAMISVFAIAFRDAIIRYLRLLWDAIALLYRIRKAIKSDTPWLVRPPRPVNMLGSSAIPILAIANLKGGVGKTTIAANLAGYFCSEAASPRDRNRKHRVLVIDLDFQGSLSSMVLRTADRLPTPNSLSKASKAITGALTPEAVADAIQGKESDFIQAIPAYYDLANVEFRVLMQWLVEDFKGDLRYVLRDLLLSQPVQDRFDLIVIDCPPRLTTALMQALCASTHLLIPTKLDRMSGEAVGTFVDQVEHFRPLWPKLKILGCVGAMVSEDPINGNRLPDAEDDGESRVRGAVKTIYERRNLNPPVDFMLPRTTYIAEKAAIARHAGDRITYLNLMQNREDVSLREMIRRLGKHVEDQIYERR
jgi:chromosome partitioning protein